MSRATVICHMGISIDGKINGNLSHAKHRETLFADYFQLHLDNFASRSHVIAIGRKTAAETGPVLEALPASDMAATVLHQDFVEPIHDAAHAQATWVAAVDPHGRCAWQSPVITGSLPQMEGYRWLEVVVQDWVSDAFLAHCRRSGIPYLFAGKDAFDVTAFLTKCKTLLGQEAVVLMGGGGVNGSFLKEKCIDELSLMVSPIVSGNPKDTGLFEPASEEAEDTLPWANFTLRKTSTTPGGHLWTYYVADKA